VVTGGGPLFDAASAWKYSAGVKREPAISLPGKTEIAVL
jgi:hypothetical protein